MNEVQHLAELREIKQRRCRILAAQAATHGTMVAPQILIEIEDLKKEVAAIETQMIVNIPPADRKNLGELWRNAMKAFFSREWNGAEGYLIQVAAIDPHYSDVQGKLKATRTHLYSTPVIVQSLI